MDHQLRPGAVTRVAELDANVPVTGPGKRTLVELEFLRTGQAGNTAPAAHPAAPPQTAERTHAFNAVLKVVAYSLDGSLIRSWAAAERARVLRVVYWEYQRRFFHGYLQAAKAARRAARNALRNAKPSNVVALEARRDTAQAGEKLSSVEPVAAATS